MWTTKGLVLSCGLLASAAVGGALWADSASDADLRPPSFLSEIDQDLREALARINEEYANADFVVIALPDDTLRVFVPEIKEENLFQLKGEETVALPDPEKLGTVDEQSFTDLIALWTGSPKTVVVCEKCNGDKCCWEEVQ